MESTALGSILTIGLREAEDELLEVEGTSGSEAKQRLLNAIETPELEIWDEEQVFEFTTRIRDKEVRCFWSDGAVSGDEELLTRIDHVLPDSRWTRDPIAVAHAVSSVVIYPVNISVRPHPTAVDPLKLPSKATGFGSGRGTSDVE